MVIYNLWRKHNRLVRRYEQQGGNRTKRRGSTPARILIGHLRNDHTKTHIQRLCNRLWLTLQRGHQTAFRLLHLDEKCASIFIITDHLPVSLPSRQMMLVLASLIVNETLNTLLMLQIQQIRKYPTTGATHFRVGVLQPIPQRLLRIQSDCDQLLLRLKPDSKLVSTQLLDQLICRWLLSSQQGVTTHQTSHSSQQNAR